MTAPEELQGEVEIVEFRCRPDGVTLKLHAEGGGANVRTVELNETGADILDQALGFIVQIGVDLATVTDSHPEEVAKYEEAVSNELAG